MTRVLICSALQIMFVTLYGAWAAFHPEAAFDWMLPFVVCVVALMIYNAWEELREVLPPYGRRR